MRRLSFDRASLWSALSTPARGPRSRKSTGVQTENGFRAHPVEDQGPQIESVSLAAPQATFEVNLVINKSFAAPGVDSGIISGYPSGLVWATGGAEVRRVPLPHLSRPPFDFDFQQADPFSYLGLTVLKIARWPPARCRD
jgi:hypothetical protein